MFMHNEGDETTNLNQIALVRFFLQFIPFEVIDGDCKRLNGIGDQSES